MTVLSLTKGYYKYQTGQLERLAAPLERLCPQPVGEVAHLVRAIGLGLGLEIGLLTWLGP